MKALYLALVLINSPAEEQELMVADLVDADPRLAVEVLDVVVELHRSSPPILEFSSDDSPLCSVTLHFFSSASDSDAFQPRFSERRADDNHETDTVKASSTSQYKW